MPEKIREARVFLSTQVRLGLDPALENVSGKYFGKGRLLTNGLKPRSAQKQIPVSKGNGDQKGNQWFDLLSPCT